MNSFVARIVLIGASASLVTSAFGGEIAWSQSRPLGGQTNTVASAAEFNGKAFAAFKELPGDRIFLQSLAPGANWSPPELIPNVGTGTAPCLTTFQNRLYGAWKGAGSDHQIWYSSTDGSTTNGKLNWTSQKTIGGAGTQGTVAIATFGNLLFAVWRGINDDQGLWYSTYSGTGDWAPQQRIPGAGSAIGVGLGVFQGRLFAIWRGINDDQQLYWASFANGQWSKQGRFGQEGSSGRPALVWFGLDLYVVWKGIGGDDNIYVAAFKNGAPVNRRVVPGIQTSDGVAATLFGGSILLISKGPSYGRNSDPNLSYLMGTESVRWVNPATLGR